MAPINRQMIEHSSDVVGGKGLRIGGWALRYVRWRIAPRVECNAPISPPEVPQLRFPTSNVACEFVHEDQRPARPGFFVVEPDPVLCNGVRHACHLSLNSGIRFPSRLHHPIPVLYTLREYPRPCRPVPAKRSAEATAGWCSVRPRGTILRVQRRA